MLKIENLHAYYGKSHVLHGVTFDVQPGEIVALLHRQFHNGRAGEIADDIEPFDVALKVLVHNRPSCRPVRTLEERERAGGKLQVHPAQRHRGAKGASHRPHHDAGDRGHQPLP